MPASSLRFSTLRYSTLSSSEDLTSTRERPGSHSSLLEYNHKHDTRKTTARSNFYTLWKQSASHDCLSGGLSAPGAPALYPARKPSSGYLESLRSNTSNEGSSVPKVDEGTWEINKPISPREHISGSASYTSSPVMTRNWCRNVPLPAYISTPDLLMEHGSRDSIIPVSEAPPCSFTLDSFMDIESINSDPLETAWETDVSVLNSGNNNKQNTLAGFSSSNAFRPSSVANGSALLSIFESRRNKRLSLPRSPALSTKTNRRGFPNLNYIRNHQKSFFLPLQRLASREVETELQPSLDQPMPSEGQKKGLPALRKRISAVFRNDLWNQTHRPNNRNSLPYPGTIQDLYSNPFYHDDPFIANTLSPSASASSAIPAFRVTPYDRLNPCISSEIPFGGISTPCDNNAIIRSDRLNPSSEPSETLTAAAPTFSIKDKPLPGIPIGQEIIDPRRSVVEEESDMNDADVVTASSCLESETECFTVLDEEWPEPPRHMTFLDPDMADAFRYGQLVGSNKKIDTCTANKKYSRDSNASENHTLQTKTCHLEETVKNLLSLFEIYLNGSRVTSEPPLPSTLIFPHDAITDPVQSGYTVGLTIRASARSQLISFCTLYADTTLTFEQPAHPSITTSKMQVGMSMKISHLPTQEEGYVEVSIIAIQERDSKKGTNDIPEIQSEGEQSPMDLVELPCTLGELAIIISKMAITA